MQGHWVAVDDPSAYLMVEGGHITCFGHAVEYDYKEIDQVDGALTVSLMINNEAEEDTFARANITGFVLTPQGEFCVYNVKFVTQFVRLEPEQT